MDDARDTDPTAPTDPDPVARIERALASLRRGGRPPWAGEHPAEGRGGPHPRSGRPHAHDADAPGGSGGPTGHDAMHGHGGPHRHGGPGSGPWAFRFGPVARHRLLATLDAEGRAMSVTELAEAVGVDQPRASRLVQGAVADGLVAREADPDDARRTRVRLTPAGAAAVRAAGARHRQAIEAALADFSDDEREVFADLLGRFSAGLRRGREH